MSNLRLLVAVLALLSLIPVAAACPVGLSVTVENRHGARADDIRVTSANRGNPRGPAQTSGNLAPEGGLAPGGSAVVLMPHCNGPFTLVVVFADGSRRTYPDLSPQPRLDLALR